MVFQILFIFFKKRNVNRTSHSSVVRPSCMTNKYIYKYTLRFIYKYISQNSRKQTLAVG